MSSKQIAEITIRPRASLTHLNLGWIEIRDHFISTVGPNTGRGNPLGVIMVLEDAIIQPQAAFPLHPHKDMEILTWVAEGVLHHRDNFGVSVELTSGMLQLMSARSGVIHAEGNLGDAPVRMLQIWIQPNSHGGEPFYATASMVNGDFQLIAAENGAPLLVRQNLSAYATILEESESALEIPENHVGYGISLGSMKWNDTATQNGDGVQLSPGTLLVSGTGQVLVLIQENLRS